MIAVTSGPVWAQQPIRTRFGEDAAAQTQSERRASDERRNLIGALPSESEKPDGSLADIRSIFRVQSIELVGATALPNSTLAPAYAEFLGRDLSQADLLAITKAITDIYRDAGFHLSRAIIPPQDLAHGRLLVSVLEGSIEDVIVAGDDTGAFGIQTLLSPISAERPARRVTLERQLLLANDRPGVRISNTSIDEIAPASGRFRLKVSVQSWRAYTALGGDNLGSAAVGPWQASGSVALNSILAAGDSLSITGSTIPNSSREMRFGRVSYDMPIGLDSFRIGASATRSNVWPGDERRWQRTSSQADTYEIRGAYAPLLNQTHALWLTGSLGISDVREQNSLGKVYGDRIRLASLAADYKLHALEGSWSYLTATYRQGLGLIDPRPDSVDWLSRRNASSHFSLFNGSFTHYQNLVENWSLKLAAAGQIANGPLLSSQQYYLGGTWFGRGFEGGWIAGDNAVAGSAELRFDQSTNFAFAKGYQLYSFIEGGLTETKLDPANLIQRVASVGVGIRVFVNDDLQFGFGIAKPISYRLPLYHDRGTTLLFSITNAMRVCPGTADIRCRS